MKSDNIENIIYRTGSAGKDFTDWVSFNAPDVIIIEREYKNGRKAKCETKLFDPKGDISGNAWTAKDVRTALAKQQVQDLIKTDRSTGEITLSGNIKGFVMTFPFYIKSGDWTITIMPSEEENKLVDEEQVDIATFVFIMTKVYQQQINHDNCKALQGKSQ